ncbi:MAG: hypothetical protein Q7R56_01090, partial [Nanoarchaeota archaeon]|nr:hypothetical protein [Nanoarchaeota archaeon]
PKGLTEEQRKSDEAKDYYFYKKMAEDQKNEETRQLFAHKSAELRRDIANTQLANELEEKNYEKLTPEVKESFKIHVATHATYYKIPSGTIIDDTYLKNKWVGLQGAKSPAEGDQTMLRAFQEDYRQKILNEKLETGLREDLTNIGFDAAEVDKSVARELQLLGYKPTAKTTNIRYVDTRDIRNEANDPTKRYYQDPDGTRYYLQPPAGVTPTPPVTTPAVGTAPTAPGVKPPTTNQLQKFFDKYGNATDIQYKIVDPNDAKTIAERLQAEHQPRVALIPEGKNKGRVQSMTINGKLYVENEYNEVGIITGQRVYERVVENDALGTTYANYIGTVPEAQKYYQEKGKTDQEAKIIAQQLDDSKSCIGQINKNLAGKTLKQGEAVRTGCKLGNYVVQNTAQKLGSSCTDFMSPDNCKMLFNACDPVICPASRCNLGGAWNVPDVVQSGLVGSTFLCINNWVVINPSQGDIYTLPVCLTGIIAGLENIQTILESYKQCLITAKVDGRSVGFCDSLRNFYLCDSLWREATALLDMENGLLGAITEQVLGANGGGEYASFKASFDKSTESLSYFTKDYAKQVFAGYNG